MFKFQNIIKPFFSERYRQDVDNRRMEEQLLAQPEEVDGKLLNFNPFVVGIRNFKK